MKSSIRITELLPDKFTGIGEVKNFDFHVHSRSNYALLYEVHTSGSIHYEVFKIRTVAKCIDFDRKIYSETSFKERYPKSKDFGLWAWSMFTERKALEKFNSINTKSINT